MNTSFLDEIGEIEDPRIPGMVLYPLYSIDPKSGHRFSDKVMDERGNRTPKIRVFR